MDIADLKELVTRLEHKSVIENGNVFEMFGSTYVAIKTNEKNPCEKCAFANANCNFNVDIPSCNNGVYFRKVKGIVLSIFDKYGMKLNNVVKIENGIVYCENNKQVSIIDLYKYGYTIKPLAIKE